MLLVRATENSIRQTESCIEIYRRCGVARLFFVLRDLTQTFLERKTIKGDSPVDDDQKMIEQILEYCPPTTG